MRKDLQLFLFHSQCMNVVYRPNCSITKHIIMINLFFECQLLFNYSMCASACRSTDHLKYDDNIVDI